jgi:hypothetical protein
MGRSHRVAVGAFGFNFSAAPPQHTRPVVSFSKIKIG